MDCTTCKAGRPADVPYIVHEGAMARAERTIRRLWILALVLIVLLAASNGAWIWYESQFEVTETEITQEADGDGVNNFIGENGDIIYGATDYQNP